MSSFQEHDLGVVVGLGLVADAIATNKNWPPPIPSAPKALVFIPDRDTHGGDWHGAFLPEAQSLCAVHGIDLESLIQVDVSVPFGLQRRRQVLAHIAAVRDRSLLAFCCHGWYSGLQVGLDRVNAPEIGKAIAAAAMPGQELAIVLYACTTGQEGDETQSHPGSPFGLAHVLRDAVVNAGQPCHIDAHTCSGHCTRNPFVRRFLADGTEEWIIEPHTEHWHRWIMLLSDTDLRFRYPLMTLAQIRAKVDGG